MSMTDPIADMLTRIRNACQAKHPRVEVPASKVKAEIARILMNQKFISHYTQVEDGKQGTLRIYLKYGPVGESVISKTNQPTNIILAKSPIIVKAVLTHNNLKLVLNSITFI